MYMYILCVCVYSDGIYFLSKYNLINMLLNEAIFYDSWYPPKVAMFRMVHPNVQIPWHTAKRNMIE